MKLGTWLYYRKLQNKFEFQGVSSIFHRVLPFLDEENITSVGDIYFKAILALVTSATEGEGGYVFTSLCLHICLSVCLFMYKMSQKVVGGSGLNLVGRFGV